MRQINTTKFIIITAIFSLGIPLLLVYKYSDLVWEEITFSEGILSGSLVWLMLLLVCAILFTIIYAIFSSITIDTQTTVGLVLDKWWEVKERTVSYYSPATKTMMTRTEKYDEYSIKVKSSYGTDTITTDVETYAKSEKSDNITVIQRTNILGEITYDLTIE